MMVEVTDPPEHRRLRRSVGAFFADGAVGSLEPTIDRHVRELVSELVSGPGPVDVMVALASQVPTHAAGLLLELPAEDLNWITARTAQVFLSGPSEDGASDLRVEAGRADDELLSYFARLLRSPRSTNSGLVRRLVTGKGNREGLSVGEAVLNALNLAIGGTTTTRSLLGNLLQVLSTRPAVLAALRADPTTVPTAVEEAVRWANPVRHLARVAVRDVELGGRAIRAGEPVVVFPRSANRDADVFEQAEEFDVYRYPNPHIGFAAGPHSCPGTGLARVQIRSVLNRLVDTVELLEPAGPAELMRSNFLHGYARLGLDPGSWTRWLITRLWL
ncbi:cytochrome P450 [Pseudonocardia sp. ICBG601]|uniref:cytochrome P450 n=1 Tax=Pseudonocardia sp. ICBG601 TaxID=2846759 RepID=UPI001CF6CD4E|nr:cytochrome P450 [Pseudonocardia sp. ICBG601]